MMRFNEAPRKDDGLAATCSKCGRKAYFPRKGMVWWQRARFTQDVLIGGGWTVNVLIPEMTVCPDCKEIRE